MSVKFTGIIEIRGINPYVLVSPDLASQIRPDWRRPMPVLVQVDGKPKPPWRINMMPVGDGSFYLYLHASVRKASGKLVGDQATFDVSFDEAYQGGPADMMLQWFSDALAEDEEAMGNWNRLTPSRQKEILRYLTSLRSPTAQQRNLKRALDVLSGEAGRFMARSWKEGE